MIPSSFEYLRASSVAEAVSALSQSDDAKVLGGGQSFIPILRLKLANPELIVDVSKVDELRGVRDDGDALVIGAMTTHDEVLRDPLVRAHTPLLAQATATVADPQVRHRGTFGGALAHADPASDLPGVALVHGAEMTLVGPNGTRTVAAADFFMDYLETALAEDELPPSGCRSSVMAGALTTRSSTGSPRPGRSWVWPRPCAGTTGTSPRRG
jgi:carbon-monoxide dehydrogenase medium subunit